MFDSDGLAIGPWFQHMLTNNGVGPLVGVALVLFVLAIVSAGMGFKSAPIAWPLIAAGLGQGILAFLVVSGAIARIGLEGQNAVTASAPSLLPWSVATIALGFAAHAVRSAWMLWASGESGRRGAAVALGVAALFGAVLGVQVVRGGTSMPAASATLRSAGGGAAGGASAGPSAGNEEIPHRCLTCRRFR